MNIRFLAAILTAITVALAGCSAPPPDQPTPAPTPTATPTPVVTPEVTPEPVDVIIGAATVDSVEVMMNASPPLVMAIVTGSLPDDCTTIGEVTQFFDPPAKTFTIRISTTRPMDAVCAGEMVWYVERVGLDVSGLPEGVYTVNANGQTTTFDLTGGESAPETGEPPSSEVIVGLAPVDRVDLTALDVFPVVIKAIIAGSLPDGCTKIGEVAQTFDPEKRTFTITLSTVRPAEAVCTGAIVPYERQVDLVLSAMPKGTYTVIANGVSASVEVLRDDILPVTPQP